MKFKLGPVEISFGKSKGGNRPQRIRSKYDASVTDHMNRRHWQNADPLSADEANNPAVRQRLRDRARYEIGNNGYLKGIVDETADSVIGTGARLNFLDDDPDVSDEVERLFDNWQKGAKIPRKLKTGYRAAVGDGEMFMIEMDAFNQRSPVRLSYRLVEAERCTSGIDTNSKNNIDGVIIDDNGEVVRYTFSREHPGDKGSFLSLFNKDLESVRADQVIHLFDHARPEQHRGVPEITCALQIGSKFRAFTQATLEAAKIAATFSGVLHTTSGAFDDVDSGGGENSDGEFESFDTFALDNGMLMTLPEGWDMTQAKAEHPTTTYAEFKKELVSEQGRSVRMPYNVAAGTSQDMNFASGQLDLLSWIRNIFIRQEQVNDDAMWVIFQKWFEEARLIPEFLPEKVRQPGYEPVFEWFYDGRGSADRLKEAKSNDINLKNGSDNHTNIYAVKGKKMRNEFKKIQQEMELAEQLGITQIVFPETVQVEDATTAEGVAQAIVEEGLLK